MGARLEPKVPLLDYKFVEFYLSISPNINLQSGVLKSILKKSVRGVIPNKLIDRKNKVLAILIKIGSLIAWVKP